MEWKETMKKYLEQVKSVVEKTRLFLRKTFSEKKNIIRFSFAALAVIVTAQLLPGIFIAGFGVALFLVILMVSLLIAARPLLEYLKLPFNIVYFGLFLWVSYFLLLLFFDWVLWYFETGSVWWVLLYSLILAVFNCIIEDLLKEE